MGEKLPTNDLVKRMEAISFVWEVLAIIAVPTTAFALLGRYLDGRYDLHPRMTVVGLVLALVLSGYLVLRKAMSFAERMRSNPK